MKFRAATCAGAFRAKSINTKTDKGEAYNRHDGFFFIKIPQKFSGILCEDDQTHLKFLPNFTSGSGLSTSEKSYTKLLALLIT
jgi:hypothetical protein